MHQYTHNLIRRAHSDFRRYGVIALDTAALLIEAGIDIERTTEWLQTAHPISVGNMEVGF